MLLDNNICSSKHVLSAISSLSNRAPLGALENRTKTQNAPIVHIQAAKGARLLKLDMALKTCLKPFRNRNDVGYKKEHLDNDTEQLVAKRCSRRYY